MRVFSWLGIAPSLSNVVGPVVAGFMIDAGGFRAAYALLLALPLVTWWCTRLIPREARRPRRRPRPSRPQSSWTLLAAPGLKRLLVVNWLLSACWDVHMFAVPILGHERGFSASTIGLIARHLHAGGQRRAPADPAVGAPHQRDRRAARGDARHRRRLRGSTRWRIRPG